MSFTRSADLQRTGIPWFPTAPRSWRVLPLVACASEKHESNRGLVESNLLSLSYGNIVRKDINSNDGLLPESFETYQIIDRGDIVLRLTDMQNDQRSLRSGIARERGIITSAYLTLRPTSLAPDYLAYQLRAIDACKVMYSMGGGLRQLIKYSDLKQLPLLAPPAQQQLAIARFLDRETAKIDALIAEQERLIALLQEKREAVISHAVTKGLDPNVPMKDSGSLWLGNTPASWSALSVRRVVDRIEQGWSPQCESAPADADEWGVLKAGCVNGGRFNAIENKALPSDLDPPTQLEVRTGDLLMSRASGSAKLIGSVALVGATRGKLLLSDKIYRIRCSSEVAQEWFALSFASRPLRQQIEAAISGAEGLANNLPQSAILTFVMCVPPLNEQMRIVAATEGKLGDLELLVAQAAKATELLRERRTALITAAVTGQIDVRGLVEAC